MVRSLLGVALSSLAACGVPPAPAANLAYALIINSGLAEQPGYTLAPVLESPFVRLGHRPLSRTPVAVVNLDGRPRSDRAPVTTDDAGAFKFRNLADGEPIFLRAQFASDPPQVLYAFARPKAPMDCAEVLLRGLPPPRRLLHHPPHRGVELSLASTILARAVARSEWLPETFEPDQASNLLAHIEARLVTVLDQLSAKSGKPVDELVTAFLSQEMPPDPSYGWVEGVDLVQLVVWDDEEISKTISESGQAWLNVTFTIQAVGDNRASYPGQRLQRYLARGETRFVCTVPPDAETYQAVSFWLNNQKVAEAERKGLTWQARVDTGDWPDGPYAVSAQAWRSSQRDPVLLGKAYLYLDNARRYVQGCPE
ncbi:MAG: hypothetical protein VKP62_11520 [Candidatus Sericytochromatia bacterium]|nr:hypothetical protein [Candidatus Sericytochromatia bacterium]